MHPGLFAIGLLLCGLTMAQGATAQSGRLFPLEVDRPGEANPPTVLVPGTFQIETGLRFEAETDDDDPDRRTLTVPDALLRLGVVERAELRLAAAGLLYEFRDGADDRALGSDLDLSGKALLWKQRAFLPATGVELGLSFPVGSKAETSGGFDPWLDALFQWEVREWAAIVANLGFSAPTQGSDDDRRIFELEPKLSLERQLTPRLAVFFEYYGAIKTRGLRDEHSLDGGFALRVGQSMMLDLSGGGGLNRAAQDWFVALGFTVRLRDLWGD
jgi:hypothetical protein